MNTLVFGRGRRSTANLLTWEGAVLRLQGTHTLCGHCVGLNASVQLARVVDIALQLNCQPKPFNVGCGP